MTPPVTLAVQGAGHIGRQHIEHILAASGATLTAIIDPLPVVSDLARSKGVAWFPSLAALLETNTKPDGLIIATPTPLHVADGLSAIAAGIAVLVEKPIADTAASAAMLVRAAEKANLPLLVGHHRRHNPMIQRARAIIDEGRVGQIVSVHGMFWLMKPDDYFDVPWRREKGAGPILTNLIHDIDLLRYLCGEIASVQAITSNAVRKFAIEETAVVVLQFASGALGTVNISDSIVAPWSWELTTGENPMYPRTNQSCYTIGGTHGSLTIPKLEVWSNANKRSWWEPLVVAREFATEQDPLRLQIEQFCRVIRGQEAPLVSGREGLETLKVIDAIVTAVATGQQTKIS
jgi:predicted dehydrogenase